MTRLILAAMLAVSLGCGSNDPPPQSTDPAALERERTTGNEIRQNLEGGAPLPK